MQQHPICVIVGAPRAASTTLFFQLQSHPQVCGATVDGRLSKETDYLCRPQHATPEGYLSLWKPSGEARVLLEASPNYTAYPYVSGIAEFLAELNRPVQIVYILRDPVDRIASHFRTKGLFPRDLSADREFLRELIISDYWLQVSQFRQFHRKGQLLLLSFPEIKEIQHAVLERVCAFLGLDPVVTQQWLDRLRPMHANLSFSEANALTHLRNTTLLQRLKAGIPLSFKATYRQLERGLSQAVPALSRPASWEPDPASVAHIRRTLKPGVLRLAEDYDVDVSSCFGEGWLY